VSRACRNIGVPFNFDPPAFGAEVRDAVVWHVRKTSGHADPSAANEAASSASALAA